jgi:hypothetical protein
MYLQTGDECQWLMQQRRSMEAEVASHLATTSTASKSRRAAGKVTIDEDFDTPNGDAVHTAVDRIVCLLQSRLAGLGFRRGGAA